MPEMPTIEVPNRKVTAIEWDMDSDTATVVWSDGTREEMIILDLVFGPQGTWARLTPVENPTFVVCVTQSATMPSETYIVYEKPDIPEHPIVVLPDTQSLPESESDVSSASQELASVQESVMIS